MQHFILLKTSVLERQRRGQMKGQYAIKKLLGHRYIRVGIGPADETAATAMYASVALNIKILLLHFNSSAVLK